LPEYDPKCYLCPGNTRANGETNPSYKTTYAFPNDFPAVKADQPEFKEDEEGAKGRIFDRIDDDGCVTKND
jgi:UDPglucose--hexose-1-phosphate uridylyltransferase